MIKRKIAVIISAAMLFSMTACGGEILTSDDSSPESNVYSIVGDHDSDAVVTTAPEFKQMADAADDIQEAILTMYEEVHAVKKNAYDAYKKNEDDIILTDEESKAAFEALTKYTINGKPYYTGTYEESINWVTDSGEQSLANYKKLIENTATIKDLMISNGLNYTDSDFLRTVDGSEYGLFYIEDSTNKDVIGIRYADFKTGNKESDDTGVLLSEDMPLQLLETTAFLVRRSWFQTEFHDFYKYDDFVDFYVRERLWEHSYYPSIYLGSVISTYLQSNDETNGNMKIMDYVVLLREQNQQVILIPDNYYFEINSFGTIYKPYCTVKSPTSVEVESSDTDVEGAFPLTADMTMAEIKAKCKGE